MDITLLVLADLLILIAFSFNYSYFLARKFFLRTPGLPRLLSRGSIAYLIFGLINLMLITIASSSGSVLFLSAMICFFISACLAWIYNASPSDN